MIFKDGNLNHRRVMSFKYSIFHAIFVTPWNFLGLTFLFTALAMGCAIFVTFIVLIWLGRPYFGGTSSSLLVTRIVISACVISGACAAASLNRAELERRQV